MKALGKSLFTGVRGRSTEVPRVAYHRVSAATLELPESWFRDAIFRNPELILEPCREGGLIPADEKWLPWKTEWNLDAGKVDVLLLSSRGRPAIIETKLSYNRERRREVVAQLLDYALALEETPLEDLPPLPDSPSAPNPDDVKDCLLAGKFLLVVAGDELDPRAVRLSEELLAGHLTKEWDLAMVDLNVFHSAGSAEELLVVPELRGTIETTSRQFIRVVVEGDTPKSKITVEPESPDGGPRTRRAKVSSIEEFIANVRDNSPAAEEAMTKVVQLFASIANASGGRFVLGLQVATANLYWKAASGAMRRVFALNENGQFRVWLAYVLNEGREDIAATIREHAKDVVSIQQGELTAAVSVGDSNVDKILEVVGSTAADVMRM